MKKELQNRVFGDYITKGDLVRIKFPMPGREKVRGIVIGEKLDGRRLECYFAQSEEILEVDYFYVERVY